MRCMSFVFLSILLSNPGPWKDICAAEQYYNDVTMGAMASQITSITIVYSTVYSGADQRKYQSSASLAFLRGIYQSPVNSPHKGPVTRKLFPFGDVIMVSHHTITLQSNDFLSVSSLNPVNWKPVNSKYLIYGIMYLIFYMYLMLFLTVTFDENTTVMMTQFNGVCMRQKSLMCGEDCILSQIYSHGPLLLTWINFDLSMDK